MYRKILPPPPDTPVNQLWNISELTACWLSELKIFTYHDLARKNLLKLWSELKSSHRQVSKLMYYALWGAVANTHWKNIPPPEIAKIDEFIRVKKPKAVKQIKITT
jgi:hypothetical protein